MARGSSPSLSTSPVDYRNPSLPNQSVASSPRRTTKLLKSCSLIHSSHIHPLKHALMAAAHSSVPAQFASACSISPARSEANAVNKTFNVGMCSTRSIVLDTARKIFARRTFSKTIIGSKPDIDDLEDYFLSGAFAVPRRDPISSLGNDLDGFSWVVDLTNMTLPDSSKRIRKENYNAYMKRRTGMPFHDTGADPEIKLEFAYAAEATSGNRRMLPEMVEEKLLNPDCVEHSSKRRLNSRFQRNAPISIEDLDELPLPYVEAGILPMVEADMIVRLQVTDNEHIAFVEAIMVRDDLPEDPYLFPSCEAGRKAAEAVELYQQDNEQIKNKVPLADIERPRQDNTPTSSHKLKEANWHLHENPRQNDIVLAWSLAYLENLHAPEPGEFLWACEHRPDDVEWGSGIIDLREDFPARYGLEAPDIAQVWREVYNNSDLDSMDLLITGLLSDEDDFGDNPEYTQAKLLWWKQKMGIDGMEAILRYHFGRIRRLRRPDTLQYFLTDEEHARLSPIPTRGPNVYVLPKNRLFAGLHAQPVDAAKEGSVVWKWLDAIDQEKLIPDNRFEEDDQKLEKLIEDSRSSLVGYDGSFCWRFAYDALLEYQNSVEPYAEPHDSIEEWARPLYMNERGKSSTSSMTCTQVQQELSRTIKALCPPGINVSPLQKIYNLNALADVAWWAPPGLQLSLTQMLQNQQALAGPMATAPAPPPRLQLNAVGIEQNKAALAEILNTYQVSVHSLPLGLSASQLRYSE
ncbi:hypothetical protein J1614_010349 [Plenodomus biglobosus]|nr:hypothetical protein J1614_010349 [Plenodomus biglobosus]